MRWSPQQDKALCAVGRWLRNPEGQQVFRLFGFAGTGKTTLAKYFAEGVSGTVRFAAFTGKAAHVMRNKGCADACTIHHLIYRLVDEEKETKKGKQRQPRFALNEDSILLATSLLIIDEGSMVEERIGRDVLRFGVPTLVLADTAQLPPPRGCEFFTLEEPDVMLTEVHRQALDNPVLHLATVVRNGEQLTVGAYGNSCVRNLGKAGKEYKTADQILVGRHVTRRKRNWIMRGQGPSLPFVGDKLVCCRNDYNKGMLNGSLWRVLSVSGDEELTLEVVPAEGGAARTVETHAAFFTGRELDWWEAREYVEFDFGYALTVHKAQGSQWDNVLLRDESRYWRDDAKRWLYTGITRAAQRITIVR